MAGGRNKKQRQQLKRRMKRNAQRRRQVRMGHSCWDCKYGEKLSGQAGIFNQGDCYLNSKHSPDRVQAIDAEKCRAYSGKHLSVPGRAKGGE